MILPRPGTRSRSAPLSAPPGWARTANTNLKKMDWVPRYFNKIQVRSLPFPRVNTHPRHPSRSAPRRPRRCHRIAAPIARTPVSIVYRASTSAQRFPTREHARKASELLSKDYLRFVFVDDAAPTVPGNSSNRLFEPAKTARLSSMKSIRSRRRHPPPASARPNEMSASMDAMHLRSPRTRHMIRSSPRRRSRHRLALSTRRAVRVMNVPHGASSLQRPSWLYSKVLRHKRHTTRAASRLPPQRRRRPQLKKWVSSASPKPSHCLDSAPQHSANFPKLYTCASSGNRK